MLCVAVFLVLLDNSLLNVALPSIRADLGFTGGDEQWVLTAYALPFGGFLLIGGRLGDLFGARTMFLAGLLTFTIASAVGGLAPEPWLLVAARVVQGLGAAALSPSAMALVLGLFTGDARSRALGVYAATATLGITAGMVVGGTVTELTNWRWVMFVNVPIALLALLPARALVPDVRAAGPRPRLGLVGAVTVTGGLVALLYAVEQATRLGWTDRHVLVGLALGALLLAVFAVAQRTSSSPLIPMVLVRDATLRAAAAVMFLKSTMGIAALFLPTLYFQQARGYSPLVSGLAFVPAGVAGLIASLTGPVLIRRLGGDRRWSIVLALGIQAVGLGLMTTLPLTGTWLVLLVGTVLLLLGFMWSDVALNYTLSVRVDEATRGAGAGVFRTAAQLGGAIGLGVLATIVAARSAGDPRSLLAGIRLGLWCGAAFAVTGLVIAAVGLRPRTGAGS